MTYDYDITFEDNLLTGNKMIDEQHKELIERIRNFVFACQDGKSKVNAIKMLDYLEEFKKTIQELYEYLHDYEGPTDQFSELVHRNVVDWLFGHIKTFDRSVAEFIFMRENPERC